MRSSRAIAEKTAILTKRRPCAFSKSCQLFDRVIAISTTEVEVLSLKVLGDRMGMGDVGSRGQGGIRGMKLVNQPPNYPCALEYEVALCGEVIKQTNWEINKLKSRIAIQQYYPVSRRMNMRQLRFGKALVALTSWHEPLCARTGGDTQWGCIEHYRVIPFNSHEALVLITLWLSEMSLKPYSITKHLSV